MTYNNCQTHEEKIVRKAVVIRILGRVLKKNIINFNLNRVLMKEIINFNINGKLLCKNLLLKLKDEIKKAKLVEENVKFLF